MGWAPGDEDKVLKAKVQLAKVRQELYTLTTIIATIEHPEKGPMLLKEVHHISDKHIAQIELQLNR